MKSTISPVLLILLLTFFSCSNDVEVTSDNDIGTVDNPDSSQSSNPNILLIIADDLGLDAAPGFNVGTTKPNMPNLQHMINNGVRFTNMWSYPTCTPTRSSILTGKYGFRTGVMKVDDELSTGETSLQKYLDTQNSGYAHAVVGKWHLSRTATHPEQMGVGYYAGLLSGGVQSYTNWNFTENGQTTTSNEYTTSKFTDLAIDWVGNQEKPWFLWLAYNAPHTPFHLPPNDLHSQGNLPSDEASIEANPLPYYMAMIEAMDTEIGRLLDSLSEEERENTVLIFIGDNGTPNSVVQEYRNRRAKGTVYQGGVNVPMIISGKNVSRFNETDNHLLNTTDLFATIASIAGVNTTSWNDSKSFKDLLSLSTIANSRNYAYTEIGKDTGGEDYTIRNATHKYIKFVNGEEALYNLSIDFFENTNLLDTNLSTEDQEQLDNLQQIHSDLKQ